QAVNLRRKGIYALAIGLGVKLISQPIFLYILGEIGMLYSTTFGLIVTIFLMFKAMHELIGYSTTFIIRRTFLILLLAFIMGIATYAMSNILVVFLSYERRLQSLIALFIVAGVGVSVFGYLALKTRLAEKIIGPQAQSLRKKLHIK